MNIERNNMKSKLTIFSLVILLVISTFIHLNSNYGKDEALEAMVFPNHLLTPLMKTITSPIFVNSNLDFHDVASFEGWTGDGTALNPYIINDYVILGTNFSIRNSDLYFVFQNNTLDGQRNTALGVTFDNVSNGEIKDSTFKNVGDYYTNGPGLEVKNSYNLLFSNNVFFNNSGDGARIENSISISVSNSESYNNKWKGIRILSSNSTILSQNNVYNNSEDGIAIDSSSSLNVTSNVLFHNFWKGLRISSSSNSILANLNNISYNYEDGIALENSNTISVDENRIFQNIFDGIRIVSSDNSKIIQNDIYDNYQVAVQSDNSFDLTISNNSLFSNSEDGVKLQDSYNVNITQNYINKNDLKGIRLVNTNTTIINGNNIVSNLQDAMWTDKTHEITVENNSFVKNGLGIFSRHIYYSTIKNNSIQGNNKSRGLILISSTNNIIHGNIIKDNIGYGIYLAYSQNNDIRYNIITNNSEASIYLGASQNNLVYNNSMNENEFLIYGFTYIDYLSNDIQNNTIDNRPLVIHNGIKNIEFTSDQGQLIVINSSNIEVKDHSRSNSILFAFSSNITISNITMESNKTLGILLYSVYNSEVVNNSVKRIHHSLNSLGADITDSYKIDLIDNYFSISGSAVVLLLNTNVSLIKNNIIENNGIGYGVHLYKAHENNVTGNNIQYNKGYGLRLFGSFGNNIYFNNFIENNMGSSQGFDDMNLTNSWSLNRIGNYYSDYTGVDSDLNKIGDSPHLLDGTADFYPLMNPIQSENMDSPLIFSPGNILIFAGELDKFAYWKVSDANPLNYSISVNQITNESGSWSIQTQFGFNLTGLSVGIHIITVQVFDLLGLSNQDSIFVTVVTLEDYPSISSPNDVTLVESTPDQILFWEVNDTNPFKYKIFLNDVESEVGNWSIQTRFGLNLTALSAGIHNVTLQIFDDTGLSRVDTVFVLIYPYTIPLFTFVSGNITFKQTSTGNIISWTIEDDNPTNYTIWVNGVVTESDSWLSGETISINVDSFAPGSYNVTIFVLDISSLSNSSSIFITVTPQDLPIFLVEPSNISFIAGEAGNILTWTVIDDNPTNFIITRDGVTVVKGFWNSNFEINLSIDDLAPGIYTFILTVYDILEESISSNVTVTVTSPQVIPLAELSITSPEDIRLETDWTNLTVSWDVKFYNSGGNSWTLFINGEGNQTGIITNNSIYTFNISLFYLRSGAYNFTFSYSVLDYNNNSLSIQDTVFINVIKRQELVIGTNEVQLEGVSPVNISIEVSFDTEIIVESFSEPSNESTTAFSAITIVNENGVQNAVNTGYFLDITISNSSALSSIWINVSYANWDLDALGIDETTLKIYFFNETTAEWESVGNTGVDIANKIIYAEVNHLTSFAAVAFNPEKNEPIISATIDTDPTKTDPTKTEIESKPPEQINGFEGYSLIIGFISIMIVIRKRNKHNK